MTCPPGVDPPSAILRRWIGPAPDARASCGPQRRPPPRPDRMTKALVVCFDDAAASSRHRCIGARRPETPHAPGVRGDCPGTW
jgi:hypothetical protein